MMVQGDKISKLRDAKNMTQEKLAAVSNVSVRTIQRAERGGPIDLESVAQIAASLGVPQSDLTRDDPQNGTGNTAEFSVIVLTPVRSTNALADLLQSSATCQLDYAVEADAGPVSAAILSCINTLQPYLPTLTPEINWDESGHSEVNKVKAKLALESEIASALKVLKEAKLTLYVGRYTARMVVPRYHSEEGHWYTRDTWRPENVTVAMLRIDQAGQERIVANLPLQENE